MHPACMPVCHPLGHPSCLQPAPAFFCAPCVHTLMHPACMPVCHPLGHPSSIIRQPAPAFFCAPCVYTLIPACHAYFSSCLFFVLEAVHHPSTCPHFLLCTLRLYPETCMHARLSPHKQQGILLSAIPFFKAVCGILHHPALHSLLKAVCGILLSAILLQGHVWHPAPSCAPFPLFLTAWGIMVSVLMGLGAFLAPLLLLVCLEGTFLAPLLLLVPSEGVFIMYIFQHKYASIGARAANFTRSLVPGAPITGLAMATLMLSHALLVAGGGGAPLRNTAAHSDSDILMGCTGEWHRETDAGAMHTGPALQAAAAVAWNAAAVRGKVVRGGGAGCLGSTSLHTNPQDLVGWTLGQAVKTEKVTKDISLKTTPTRRVHVHKIKLS
eukprot:1136623-Pelagomonas_calceolata.AAC.1